MSDKGTLQVYDDKAKDYAARFQDKDADETLRAFITAIPAGGRVLDYGCGPGRSAMHMARAGLVVDAFDGSLEMVALARQHPGVTAWQATFDSFAADALYDGIWANFSLLHADRDDIPNLLGNIRKALKDNGIFHIGVKEGSGTQRDRIGRRYTYFTLPEMQGLLRDAGLTPGPATTGQGPGLDGTVSPWFTLTAHA